MIRKFNPSAVSLFLGITLLASFSFTALAMAEEQPIDVKTFKAHSVSGRLHSYGGAVEANELCSVTRYEYSSKIVFVIDTNAYTYTPSFGVSKTLLPLKSEQPLRTKNTKLGGYLYKPNFFGPNGELISYYKRFYADSKFTPYSGEFRLEVTPDLSEVLTAKVELDDPFGDEGSLTCRF